MNLRRLDALLAVAEHRSFSAAATALHTVQSNVSTHVKRLERELGEVLIDRETCELTPEGEIVADRTRRVLHELRALEDDLLSLREDVAGSVRAGVIGTTAIWLAPALLDSMARHHPRVHLTFVEATTTSLLPQLLSGRLDLAVVNLPVDDPDIDTTMLFSEQRVVIAPESHPLARSAVAIGRSERAENPEGIVSHKVGLETLAEHEILLPPAGTAFRDQIDIDARRAKVVLAPRAELDGFRLLTSLALQGFAPALVPASAVPTQPEPRGRWRCISVEGLSDRQVGLALPRRMNPAASARVVVEKIHEVVAEFGPQAMGVRLVEAPDPAPTGRRQRRAP